MGEYIFLVEAIAIITILGGGIWWFLSSKKEDKAIETIDTPILENEEVAKEEPKQPSPKKTSIFTRIKNPFRGLLTKTIDEDILESLEESLVMADVGVETTEKLLSIIKKNVRADVTIEELREALRKELIRRLGNPASLNEVEQGPLVILVIGVNGAGKTTTIGKLAHRYKKAGKKVLLAAGDT